jgi:hypothetical protein
METGKVEFAPDYKSKSQVKRLAAQGATPITPDLVGKGTFAEMKRDAEHARLKDAVVEAAKAECAAYSAPGSFGWTANHKQSQIKLRTATRALISFEAEHKIGE